MGVVGDVGDSGFDLVLDDATIAEYMGWRTKRYGPVVIAVSSPEAAERAFDLVAGRAKPQAGGCRGALFGG